MKLKAVRAVLVAALMTALSISLFPTADSYADATQSQQGAATPRPRRGKNGATVPGTPDNQASGAQEQTPSQDPKPPPVEASTNPTAASGSREPQVAEQQPSAQQDAPPFDRAPIRGGQRHASGNDSTSPAAPQPPVYSRESPADRFPNRSDSSRPQRDRSSDSGGGVVAPERSERSGGPPVLRRPADARPRDENRTGDVSAGQPSNQPPDADEVIKLESTLVNIPLLVSDRSGRYVPQLSARDFALQEDGVQQTIASFGSEEVPFNVALLLDVSPSVAGSIEDIQDAAIAFVRQLRDQDRVMVVSFDRGIHYLSDFTSDRRQLESAIRRASTGSGTSVYDAVYETVERKLRGIEGRKALILFSDGEDTTSGQASYDDAVNLVSEADVLVYGLRYPGGGGRVQVDPWPRNVPRVPLPLPFPWPWPTPRRRRGPFTFLNWTASANPGATPSLGGQTGRRRRGGDFMADITAAGGGPVYDAEKIGDLSRLASRIAEELRHVYVISYYPTNPLSKGGYRSVRVSVPGRSDIAVRHRKGYNARQGGSGKPTI
jgi:Ca-activated chloride channel family protein